MAHRRPANGLNASAGVTGRPWESRGGYPRRVQSSHFGCPRVPGTRFLGSMFLPSVHRVLSWYLFVPGSLEWNGGTLAISLTSFQCMASCAGEYRRCMGSRQWYADDDLCDRYIGEAEANRGPGHVLTGVLRGS